MVLAIFIVLVFQVFAEFNRLHLPPLTYPKREDEEMEGGTSNKKPAPSSGKPILLLHRRYYIYFLAQH